MFSEVENSLFCDFVLFFFLIFFLKTKKELIVIITLENIIAQKHRLQF